MQTLLASQGFDGHPTVIADLENRRLVVSSETDHGRKLRSGVIKALTGDASITARKMRQDPRTFSRTNKTVLCTNNLPKIDDQSEGMWRRIRAIPFLASFIGSSMDTNLPVALKKESEGVLAWMVRGSVEWYRHGLEEVPEIMMATQSYREDEDALLPWVDECCQLGEDNYGTRESLWKSYQDWSGKRPAFGRGSFYAALREHGFIERRRQVEGARVREFVGIGLCYVNTETG